MSWETVRVVMHPSQQKSIPPKRDEDRRRREKDPLRFLQRDLGADDTRRHHLFREDEERFRRLEPHADRIRLEAAVSQHGCLVGGEDERAARARQEELKVKPDSARVIDLPRLPLLNGDARFHLAEAFVEMVGIAHAMSRSRARRASTRSRPRTGSGIAGSGRMSDKTARFARRVARAICPRYPGLCTLLHATLAPKPEASKE